MNITIFAATGGIGRHLVDQALAAGHDVTAVARNPRNLPAGVRTVTADLMAADPAALEQAVGEADAVLSGLGPTGKSDHGVARRGTEAIIAAMHATAVRRIVIVSAAPVGTVPTPGRPNPPKHDPGDGFFMRYLMSPMIKRALKDHYQDLALMEEALRDSGLDWTTVRPPRLTDKPRTGAYRTAFGQNIRGGAFISRADVADSMLTALDRPETIKQVVGVAN